MNSTYEYLNVSIWSEYLNSMSVFELMYLVCIEHYVNTMFEILNIFTIIQVIIFQVNTYSKLICIVYAYVYV